MDYTKASWKDLYERIKGLESENARLRQQRDAANAQLGILIEEGPVRGLNFTFYETA